MVLHEYAKLLDELRRRDVKRGGYLSLHPRSIGVAYVPALLEPLGVFPTTLLQRRCYAGAGLLLTERIKLLLVDCEPVIGLLKRPQ